MTAIITTFLDKDPDSTRAAYGPGCTGLYFYTPPVVPSLYWSRLVPAAVSNLGSGCESLHEQISICVENKKKTVLLPIHLVPCLPPLCRFL